MVANTYTSIAKPVINTNCDNLLPLIFSKAPIITSSIPIIKRIKHYKQKLQVLGIKILDRKECDRKLMKFKKNNMSLDQLCAGSNAQNKSPCNVSGCSLIT